MSKTISIATQKGGVGKTTSTGALAACFKKKGHKVLAVDMDPQGNLSFSMGADTEMGATIYDVIRGEAKARVAVQHTGVTDIIPASILLSGIELEFTGPGREYLLRDALEPLREYYDYILIDSPPGLGALTVNALTASDYVIIPMLSDIFSLQGLAQLYDTVEHIRLASNPALRILGILLVRFSPRSRLGKEVHGTAGMIANSLGIPLFNTYIRNCVALPEAQSLQRSIVEYSPRCSGVLDYLSLIRELKERGI